VAEDVRRITKGERMTEERMPTFIPGDEPTYQIAFVCSVNIETVTAVFRNRTTGAEIILTGEAQMIAKPRVRGARTHTALLHVDRDSSDEPETGRYRLARLEARTYRGTRLDFDKPTEDAFSFEDEPAEIDPPRLARGLVEPASRFVLPDGHPNTPPSIRTAHTSIHLTPCPRRWILGSYTLNGLWFLLDSSWIHRLGAYHGVVRGCYVTLAFPPRPFSLTALSHELLRRGILGNLFLMPTAQTHPAYERP
jgi:hypothetical protein